MISNLKAVQLGFTRPLQLCEKAFSVPVEPSLVKENPLREYFESHTTGPGIWKWDHYLDAYNKHLAPYVGKEVTLLEIGVYSGGSLGMWQSFLGPKAKIIGVDIAPECKVYENDRVKIYIGDQADRNFWKKVRDENPKIDIVIDDGGHEPDQQRISFEELFPHLRAGGVYFCEDVHHAWQKFHTYLASMTHQLNELKVPKGGANLDEELHGEPNPVQQAIESVSFHPFLSVVKKHKAPLKTLVAPRHGTEWQPFRKAPLASNTL